MEWKDFILQHEGDDLARLVLARDRYPEVDVALAATTIECRRRLRLKVPEWYARPELVFPLRLSAEQCSSSATARYKARLAASHLQPSSPAFAPAPAPAPAPPLASASVPTRSNTYSFPGGTPSFTPSPHRKGRLADLTGGLGVDSWAFSELFEEVLYNEMLPELVEAAKRNFAVLGADNIRVCCQRIASSSAAGEDTVTVSDLLGDFHPDVIFLDPARRGAGGRKVFLLEDCSPDVTTLLPDLFAAAPYVLLKLSPMADITMLLGRLPYVREVHVVATEGECKELLLLLERGFAGEAEIVAAEIPEREGRDGVSFRFRRAEEAAAVPEFGVPGVGDLLFEPGKALSKAGCFNLISERFALRKLSRNTHLYCKASTTLHEEGRLSTKMAENVDNPPDVRRGIDTSGALGAGKWFRVMEVLPLDKRGIAEAGAKYPGADVSARGVPLSSEDLAARMKKAGKGRSDSGKIQDGAPSVHLWGVRCDVAGQNLLLVTERQIDSKNRV